MSDDCADTIPRTTHSASHAAAAFACSGLAFRRPDRKLTSSTGTGLTRRSARR